MKTISKNKYYTELINAVYQQITDLLELNRIYYFNIYVPNKTKAGNKIKSKYIQLLKSGIKIRISDHYPFGNCFDKRTYYLTVSHNYMLNQYNELIQQINTMDTVLTSRVLIDRIKE